jgi:hypothetical protein
VQRQKQNKQLNRLHKNKTLFWTQIRTGYVENTNPTIGIVANPDQLVPLVRPSHQACICFHVVSPIPLFPQVNVCSFQISEKICCAPDPSVLRGQRRDWRKGCELFAHSIRHHLSLSVYSTLPAKLSEGLKSLSLLSFSFFLFFNDVLFSTGSTGCLYLTPARLRRQFLKQHGLIFNKLRPSLFIYLFFFFFSVLFFFFLSPTNN